MKHDNATTFESGLVVNPTPPTEEVSGVAGLITVGALQVVVNRRTPYAFLESLCCD
jgi:hypothetical protein